MCAKYLAGDFPDGTTAYEHDGLLIFGAPVAGGTFQLSATRARRRRPVDDVGKGSPPSIHP